jgi:hypothetical protein
LDGRCLPVEVIGNKSAGRKNQGIFGSPGVIDDSPRKNLPATDTECRQIMLLTAQIKSLALHLALNLARSKQEIKELTVLEPEFTKLVNGSVEIVREVTAILKAFRNEERMVYSSEKIDGNFRRIEVALNEILALSEKVQEAIASIKARRNYLDKP